LRVDIVSTGTRFVRCTLEEDSPTVMILLGSEAATARP
jgi:hypothetical protein